MRKIEIAFTSETVQPPTLQEGNPTPRPLSQQQPPTPTRKLFGDDQASQKCQHALWIIMVDTCWEQVSTWHNAGVDILHKSHHHLTHEPSYNIVKSTQHGLGTLAEAQSKFPMFSAHKSCISMVTLDPHESNGQEFDLNMLSVFLGIYLFFSLCLFVS